MTSLKQHDQRLIGPGPVHHGDHPQAFVVDLAKALLWHCLTRCRGGGNVLALVQRMDHCPYPELARYLASFAQLWPASARAEATAAVECPWGVMRLAQIGIPAVALLGIHLSRTQVQLLRRTPRIVLMLDGDQAGRSASRQIVDTLDQYTRTPVHRIDLPRGLDPDDLDNFELSRRLSPLLP